MFGVFWSHLLHIAGKERRAGQLVRFGAHLLERYLS